MKKLLIVVVLIGIGWYFLRGRNPEAKRLSFEGNWSVTRTRENFIPQSCTILTNGKKFLVKWGYMTRGLPQQEIFDGKSYYESNVERKLAGKIIGEERSWSEALASQNWHASAHDLREPSQSGESILGRPTNLYQIEGQSNWVEGGTFKQKVFVDPQTDLVLKLERTDYAPDGFVVDVYTYECKKLDFVSVPDSHFPLPESIY